MTDTKRLTSIVSYPERGEGGSNKYRGNCSPLLIEDLIRHFGVKQISDYMAGSNTTGSVANRMGVVCNSYDLHSGFDLLNHDIPERPEFIFCHPPYHNMIVYSDNMYSSAAVQSQFGYDPRQSDLSRMESWEKFVGALNHCIMKQFAALDKGGRMALLVGDLKRKGKLYSMVLEMVKPGTIENVVIKVQHNCQSDSVKYSGNFIPIQHEYLVLLKKDSPLIYPLLYTTPRTLDVRDMKSATWKDVVADALDSLPGRRAELSELYEIVGAHKRAKENQFWKEKLRQTLQIYPDIFCNIERGVWLLNKNT